jgi:hypothetical protein
MSTSSKRHRRVKAISFRDPAILDQIETAATSSGETLSQWVVTACQDRLAQGGSTYTQSPAHRVTSTSSGGRSGGKTALLERVASEAEAHGETVVRVGAAKACRHPLSRVRDGICGVCNEPA